MGERCYKMKMVLVALFELLQKSVTKGLSIHPLAFPWHKTNKSLLSSSQVTLRFLSQEMKEPNGCLLSSI